jgi:outer membrane protein assembly factor BamB
MVSDTGIVMCLNAATGEMIWQKRLRGRFSASPLLVADKLLLVSEEGVTHVLQTGDRLEVLAENELRETILATPAVVGGRIYFRSTTGLLCVGR